MASTLAELFRESFSSPALCWYTCQATQKPLGQLFIDPFAACCVQKLLCHKSVTKVCQEISHVNTLSLSCVLSKTHNLGFLLLLLLCEKLSGKETPIKERVWSYCDLFFSTSRLPALRSNIMTCH